MADEGGWKSAVAGTVGEYVAGLAESSDISFSIDSGFTSMQSECASNASDIQSSLSEEGFDIDLSEYDINLDEYTDFDVESMLGDMSIESVVSDAVYNALDNITPKGVIEGIVNDALETKQAVNYTIQFGYEKVKSAIASLF